ncbi:EEFSEC [Bugula neritina]|uniref:EEFSEC n=1 Tax=Bugula neritina TaxID=10212 RepID=A0A7J7JP90_BUGNE|nr:EEFSEC [Bugula neritina]
MTGTILQGHVNVNDTVEIPHLKVTKKVKSMQMFRKPVTSAKQGDRLGICVTQFDPSQFERGYVCAASTMSQVHGAIVSIHRIAYYKSVISSKHKFHITIGHDTVMASLQLFATANREGDVGFTWSREFIYVEELNAGESSNSGFYALLQFEKPITCMDEALFIGSKLDLDVNTQSCRIAFHGKLIQSFTDADYQKTKLSDLKVYKSKERKGVVERIVDDYTVIGRNLFKKETNIQSFVGMKVELSTGEAGVIEGSFGQSGKFKVAFRGPLNEDTKSRLSAAGKKKSKSASADEVVSGSESVEILLSFKRYIYDEKKAMKQT